MDQNKNQPQPEQPLNPEEQLDLLLEKFLEEPDDLPPTTDASTQLPQIQEEAENEVVAVPLSPEEQLDALLATLWEDTNEPTEKLPVVGEPAEEPSIEDEPVEELPIEGEPAEELPIEDEPAEELPIEDEPAEELPIEDEPAEELPIEDEPVEELPIEDEPAEELPIEDEPAEELPIEDEPVEEPQDPLTQSLLEDPQAEDLIAADEQAAEEAGLTHPDDLEFDRIVHETQQEQLPEKTEDDTTHMPKEDKITPQDGTTLPVTPEEEKSTPREDSTSQPEEEKKEDKVTKTEEDTSIPEEPEPEPLPPPKKRRPKNNKTYGFFGIPHLLTTVIWLGIVVFIGVGLGKFVWNCAADVLALGRPDSQVVITITEEDDLDSIAQKLKTTGLIQYPSLFKIYGQISDAMDSIRSGSFTLNTKFDYHALVGAMSSNQRRITVSVTVPEGYNCAQMFRLLESKGVCTVEKLEAAAASGELGDYWFLEEVERGSANCLEGFLFPDTYTFYLDHDPVAVLKKFLDNFNKRFNEAMKIKLDTLNMTLAEMMRENGLSEDYIAANRITVKEIVIIASMIQKETSSNPESYLIASVIYNRLTNPDAFPYLQIDATLVYYTGRSEITMDDLTTDHPYNTYTRPGLIPGAISNPGIYSLDAALDPTETEYYFYALDPSTGTHHFSQTLKEHNDFLESIRKEEEDKDPEEDAQG